MESRAQRRIPASLYAGIAALVALVVLSFQQLSIKELLHTRGRFHFWGHFGFFALIEVLLATGLGSLRSRLIGAGAMIGVGCAIEVLQNLIYGQPVETSDMLVDALGVIAGLILVLLWDRLTSASRLHR